MDEHGQYNLLCGLFGNRWNVYGLGAGRWSVCKWKDETIFVLIFCFTDLTLGSIIFQKLTGRTVALDMIQ